MEEAIEAFKTAAKVSENILVEKHIHGADFRLLVINFKLVAVLKASIASSID